MKRTFIAIYLFLVILFVSCGGGANGNRGEQSEDNSQASAKVGLALGSFGLGDQSFNDMLYNGLIKAAGDYTIEVMYTVADADTEEAYRKQLGDMVSNHQCDIIIAGEGFKMAPIANELGALFTNTYFVAIDYEDTHPNLVSTSFGQKEGSFVVGVLAALMTETDEIGFIGGVDIPVVLEFEEGFRAGVRYAKPSVDVLVEYVTRNPDYSGFNDPERGYTVASRLYRSDIDIIFSVAGATGNGIIQAANEQQKYVIGVDSNQDHMAPGFVLTSMMKRLDIAIHDIVGKYLADYLEKGVVYEYTYQNGGISLTEMKYTKDKIPAGVLARVREVEARIANGALEVEQYAQ